MIDTAAALREVSGREMYRRNAFRITGLNTDADRNVVRRRRQRLEAALSVGATVDLGHDLPVGPDEMGAAFECILGDPRRRLVHELFWLWGADSRCACPSGLHAQHDAAVRSHSDVLDRELAPGDRNNREVTALAECWRRTAELWATVLRRAAFWDHVRHRIVALDDRQLDASAVDQLRDRMRVTLVRPLVEIGADLADPEWFVDQARRWQVPERELDDLLMSAAAPEFDEADGALEAASALHRSGSPETAGLMVCRDAVPALDWLERFVPHERHRRTGSVRNRAAVLLNNCANDLLNQDGPDAAPTVRDWLGTAAGLASDDHTRDGIRSNRDGVDAGVRELREFEKQVMRLVRQGRSGTARMVLRQIRREHPESAPQVDRLLAMIDGATPAERAHRRIPAARSAARRDPAQTAMAIVFAVVLVALVVVCVAVGAAL